MSCLSFLTSSDRQTFTSSFVLCWQSHGEAGSSAQRYWGGTEWLSTLWQTVCICLLTQAPPATERKWLMIACVIAVRGYSHISSVVKSFFLFLAWLVDFKRTYVVDHQILLPPSIYSHLFILVSVCVCARISVRCRSTYVEVIGPCGSGLFPIIWVLETELRSLALVALSAESSHWPDYPIILFSFKLREGGKRREIVYRYLFSYIWLNVRVNTMPDMPHQL